MNIKHMFGLFGLFVIHLKKERAGNKDEINKEKHIIVIRAFINIFFCFFFTLN